MANLILKDVAKSYGSVDVLKHIDLDIQTGELIVFVGPSGCGKSTLLRMVAGLEKITGGTLEIDGMVVNEVPPSERGDRDGVPILCALPPYDRAREYAVRAQDRAHAPSRDR